MKLEESAAKAGQLVKSVRTDVEKLKVKLAALESLMQPLQQQILNQDYPQQGVCSEVIEGQGLEEGTTKASLQLPEYAANFEQMVKSQTFVAKAERELEELDLSIQPLLQYLLNQDYPNCHKHGVCSEVVSAPPDSIQSRTNADDQKFFGHTVNTEFSVLQDVKVPNQCSVENQFLSSSSSQADQNDKPQEIKPKTLNGQHLMRKKQGQIALKVFFFMYTAIVLPKTWNKAKEVVEKKKNDAEREREKLKDMTGPPESAATVKTTWAAIEEAKMLVNYCKNLLQLVGQKFQNQVYPDCHKQRGVISEASGFNYQVPAGSIQNEQSYRIYEQKCNDMVLGDFLPESGQMLESWKATGCSNGTNSFVAPEADVNLSSIGNFQGCRDLGDSESLVMEIKELFPQIADDGFIEVLLEMAKSIPQRLEPKDSNQELESMDMWVLQLEEKVDKTCQEVGALGQNKSKFYQRTKVQTKGKRKRSG